LATPRRPRNLPAARPNPLRDLVSQKTRAAEAARERRRVQELKSELPSIIQERVGEHIQKLETKLLSEVKELSQRTIEQSTAAISNQLGGRIDTLEKVSQLQTETLESLRDTSRMAEQKVSSVVEQIESSLASAVPGFKLEPSRLPPLPDFDDPYAHPGDSRRSLPSVPGSMEIAQLPRLKMPPMPAGERLMFSAVRIKPNGIDQQFLLGAPAEPPHEETRDIGELVGRHGFCPNCTSTDVRRANRRGMVENMLRMFSIAPFRCRSCRHKFYRF
jgi:hypothetical protein